MAGRTRWLPIQRRWTEVSSVQCRMRYGHYVHRFLRQSLTQRWARPHRCESGNPFQEGVRPPVSGSIEAAEAAEFQPDLRRRAWGPLVFFGPAAQPALAPMRSALAGGTSLRVEIRLILQRAPPPVLTDALSQPAETREAELTLASGSPTVAERLENP